MSSESTTATPDLTSLSLDELSSIASIISEIREKIDPELLLDQNKLVESALPKYISGLDDYANYVYLEAEIRLESLDQGSDPTELACGFVRCLGTNEDQPAHYISKELGGDGNPRNIFPLYKNVDLTKWKTDQSMVYLHVKKDANHWANLFFGISYDIERKLRRPIKIVYKFDLYQNEIISHSIVGELVNPYPSYYK